MPKRRCFKIFLVSFIIMNKPKPVDQIILSQLPPASSILAGASLGESHSAIILQMATALNLAAVKVILDFQGTESATASYLKALFKIFTADDGAKTQLYPLVTNVEPGDLGFEIESFLRERGLAVQQVAVVDGVITPIDTLGSLDLSARAAYDELIALNESTASNLHERNPRDASSQTAWNNRLVKLFELRLAHRTRVGRHWMYQPAFNL